MKKILITGAEGNIGKPLTKLLKEKGYQVLALDIKPRYREGYIVADITKPADLIDAFEWKPDYVFHLAAMVSRVTCEQSGSMAIDTNVVGTQNIINFTKKCGAKLINFSTSEIYGPNDTMMDESLVPNPNNRYGLSKLLAEKLIEYEVREHGLKAVTLRPFMIYDENEDLGDHRSAMIRFATNLAKGESIEVHEGSARGWFHISDAIKSIESAMHLDEYKVINIGNPEVRTIAELAELIRAELDADKKLITTVKLPRRMTLVKQPKLDLQKELLGVDKFMSLEEGVKRVCANVVKRLEL